MQVLERDDLTAGDVQAIIEADQLQVDVGCDLLDDTDTFVEDISGDLEPDGSSVEHGNYRTIHTTCKLVLGREVDWSSQRVRPWMTLTSTAGSARFNLGVFLLATPERHASDDTFNVEGYDKLTVLDTPYGATYVAAAGDDPLDLVEALIEGEGETKILTDRSSTSTLPADRVWPIDDKNTVLAIVNDLLDGINYRAVWVDWDGYYRLEPYRSPSSVGAEWVYDADSDRTTLSEDRSVTVDLFDVPNRWIFVRTNASDAPVLGDGLYVVDNLVDGPTSQAARGRVIRRIARIDAVDHAALVAAGDRIVEENMGTSRSFTVASSPNPAHWHFDVIQVLDATLGINEKVGVRSWTLPLDGGDMRIEAGTGNTELTNVVGSGPVPPPVTEPAPEPDQRVLGTVTQITPVIQVRVDGDTSPVTVTLMNKDIVVAVDDRVILDSVARTRDYSNGRSRTRTTWFIMAVLVAA